MEQHGVLSLRRDGWGIWRLYTPSAILHGGAMVIVAKGLRTLQVTFFMNLWYNGKSASGQEVHTARAYQFLFHEATSPPSNLWYPLDLSRRVPVPGFYRVLMCSGGPRVLSSFHTPLLAKALTELCWYLRKQMVCVIIEQFKHDREFEVRIWQCSVSL